MLACRVAGKLLVAPRSRGEAIGDLHPHIGDTISDHLILPRDFSQQPRTHAAAMSELRKIFAHVHAGELGMPLKLEARPSHHANEQTLRYDAGRQLPSAARAIAYSLGITINKLRVW